MRVVEILAYQEKVVGEIKYIVAEIRKKANGAFFRPQAPGRRTCNCNQRLYGKREKNRGYTQAKKRNRTDTKETERHTEREEMTAV